MRALPTGPTTSLREGDSDRGLLSGNPNRFTRGQNVSAIQVDTDCVSLDVTRHILSRNRHLPTLHITPAV